MDDYLGWVKLYRNLHGAFSKVPKTDFNCWLVYVHLLEYCMWKDGDHLKQGQIIRTIIEIEAATFYLDRNVIRACIKILIDKEFIAQERVSKWNNSGYIFTVFVKKSYQQTTNTLPTTYQQLTNITDCNDEENDGSKITLYQQLTNTLPTTYQSIREEERSKKKEKRSSYSNTGYQGVTESSLPQIAATHQSTPSMPKKPPKSSEIWEAYKDAFMARYGQEPKRNAKVNALACQLHDRLGKEDAIEVVKFYLTHNNAWYLRNLHSLDQCVKDCEKIYVEWKKNDYVRTSDVQSAERMSDNESVIRQAMQRYLDKKEASERERQ
jgi:hypothetical protein